MLCLLSEQEAAEQEEDMNADHSADRSLGTIAEDDDTPNSEVTKTEDTKDDHSSNMRTDDVVETKDTNQGLGEEHLATLSKYIILHKKN